MTYDLPPDFPPPLTSPRLAARAGVRHGFFTRRGGVSTGDYASLNAGPGSRDDPAAVAENRRRVARAFAAEPAALLTCYQIHSTLVRVADGPWDGERPEGDAIATRTQGLVCSVLTADCAPVLLADAGAGVVAAVHAGWKGALDGVVASAVTAMTALGARPGEVTAAIGPCIAQASYEVGLEFLARFVAHDPGSERFFVAGDTPDKRRFDLPDFVLQRLEQAGVGDAEWIGRDTCAESEHFFSNRRAFHHGEADYGRLISAIVLA
jgi:YfiH family protein